MGIVSVSLCSNSTAVATIPVGTEAGRILVTGFALVDWGTVAVNDRVMRLATTESLVD